MRVIVDALPGIWRILGKPAPGLVMVEGRRDGKGPKVPVLVREEAVHPLH
jgi:hypothetical protein